ncbi:MAG: carbon dioxide concentrating mechanism protein CcmL [Planctomycetales bacterium]|nr:carbon dioxide concentrating mechanism protein CcmL [Planctomycetales bacterium]
MKIFEVVGNVTLSRCHPSFAGARLVAAEPASWPELGMSSDDVPDLLVVWDELGAGIGCQIAVSDGAEAAQPFRPALKPVDAYLSAILDEVHLNPSAVSQLKN